MTTMIRNTITANPIGSLKYYAGLSATRLLESVLTWQRRHQERRLLMTLDDRILKDIGLQRTDIDTEAKKPFWQP